MKISWCFTGYTLGFLTYYLMVFSRVLQPEYDYMVSIAMSFFIFFIGYSGYRYPQMLGGFTDSNGKYEKSGLTSSAARHFADKLKTHMQVNKPYLENDLKLPDLAGQLNISPHYLSQVINGTLNQSFSDFVNSYRIKEAMEFMRKPENKDEKIINIAYRAGFNTKVSFNHYFRKNTGMSPGKWKKENMEPKITSDFKD